MTPTFAASYYLVLILFGSSPSMTTMPQTYNWDLCNLAGKEWEIKSNNAYRREYHCALRQPGSEPK